MRSFILPLALALAVVSPVLASIGDITIGSFIAIGDNFGEVRGKVVLNGEPGAIVSVKNGGAVYSTLTDEKGSWSVLLALRSNSVEASARSLSGQGAPTLTEAEMGAKGQPLPPGTVELYTLAKGLLDGSLAADSANLAKLVRVMDAAILHAGGWEFDNRMVLLMVGTLGRVAGQLDKAPEAERAAMMSQLGAMGKLLYKGVVRGMDGQPAVH